MNGPIRGLVPLMLLAVLGACNSDGEGPSPATLAGSWNATRFEYVSTADASQKVDVVSLGTNVAMELLESGTFTILVTEPGEPDFSVAGTWSASSDVLTFNFTSGLIGTWQFDMSLSGGTLSLAGAHGDFDFDDDGTVEDARVNATFARQ